MPLPLPDRIGNYLRLNSSRVYLDQFAAQAAASLPDGARVLDAGAGDALYAPHFARQVYETADFNAVEYVHKRYAEQTYVCDLAHIPVEDERYALVFCSQVLEHLPDPAAVLREFHRVLAPGGTLWLSAPLYYMEHEQPYDFYRYTQFGFRHQFEQAGFAVQQLDWLEGYYGTLCTQLRYAAVQLPLSEPALGIGNVAFVPLAAATKLTLGALSIGLGYLDLRAKRTDRGHCINYVVVGQKPD